MQRLELNTAQRHRGRDSIAAMSIRLDRSGLASALLALVLLATSCGGVGAAPPGLSEHTLESGGVDRGYSLFVPQSNDGETLLPLVLNFHGGADNAEGHIGYSGFNLTAEAEGIVVAYPEGIDRFWNFDDAEVEFVQAVVDHVAERAPIDRTRIYLTGMSIGGDLASYLTCADPGVYAAVASVAVVNHHGQPGCPATQPVPFLGIVGAVDDITILGVQDVVPGVDTPGPLGQELRGWAETNGCDPDAPVRSENNLVFSQFECTVQPLEIIVHSGDHIWPDPDDGLDTNTRIWDFLSRFTTE